MSYDVPTRIVYTSTLSGEQTVDEFTLSFKSKCYLTTLTTASATSEYYTYNLDDASMEIEIVFESSDSYDDCPYTCIFELYDELSQSWVGLD